MTTMNNVFVGTDIFSATSSILGHMENCKYHVQNTKTQMLIMNELNRVFQDKADNKHVCRWFAVAPAAVYASSGDEFFLSPDVEMSVDHHIRRAIHMRTVGGKMDCIMEHNFGNPCIYVMCETDDADENTVWVNVYDTTIGGMMERAIDDKRTLMWYFENC